MYLYKKYFENRSYPKKYLNASFIVLLLAMLFFHAAFIQANAVYAQADSISGSILRLRVIANSDSEEDQNLKLVFKSRLCEILEPYLSNCPDVETAIDWIQNNLPFIQEQSEALLTELNSNSKADSGFDNSNSETSSGFGNSNSGAVNNSKSDSNFESDSGNCISPISCTVELTESNFPTRTYGDVTFPPGNYRTLLVTLGNGKGRNWWCVLYPSLCFTDESTASFSKDAQTKLQQTLSEEDYECINQGVTYRFRIAELIGNLVQQFH